ncbi:MAG: helix-turn-helix domain-containing protein [Lachnospiraceae bacterium]|nr:helix-turn-helix domain-containing protein [Lachnospiraceae bacterium]
MTHKSTDELKNELKTATNLRDYLSKNKENLLTTGLPEYLERLLSQKGLKKADVIRSSLLGRAYVYKIFGGEKKPSRDKLLAIAFGLGLSDQETQEMLKLSGNRELYPRDERDAVILFALQRSQSILEANELLDDQGLAILDTSRE